MSSQTDDLHHVLGRLSVLISETEDLQKSAYDDMFEDHMDDVALALDAAKKWTEKSISNRRRG